MKVHNLNSIVNDPDYREVTELRDYELETFSDVDEVWYQYEYGSYEGYGYALLRKGEFYELYDMGHCSCYGPTEYYSGFTSTKSLAELIAEFEKNPEYHNLVKHLLSSAS